MLRTLFPNDLNDMMVVEQSVHVAPWTRETFLTCFQTGCVGWAFEVDKKVVGFVLIAMHVGECHILNICLSHAHQRKGFGKQLLDQVLQHAKQKNLGIVYLEVRRSNSRAINLYKKAGFILVGERKGYYPAPDGAEDALIFARSMHDYSHS